MKDETKRTMSVRLSLEDFAKARDGLITRGVPANKLVTNSQILKTAILMCCILNDDPKSPASADSTETIKQIWKIN